MFFWQIIRIFDFLSLSADSRYLQSEPLKALQDTDSDKTPGTDGLPSEFYKVFWDELADILIDALNYSHENGKLSDIRKTGNY